MKNKTENTIKNKKSFQKKFFKRFLYVMTTFVLCLCMVFGLTGCRDTVKNDAQDSLENILTAFRSGDREEIDKYYSFERITAYIDKQREEYKNILISTLSDMEYDIKSAEKISAETVKINISVDTVDFSAVIDDFITKMGEITDSSQYKSVVNTMTDEEYNRLVTDTMGECVRDNKDKKTSSNLDITMIKSADSGWIIGGNSEEILGVLFANISNAADYLT